VSQGLADPPPDRRSLWHPREALPTQSIAAAAPGRPFPTAAGRVAVPDVAVPDVVTPDAPRTVAAMIAESFTDAWLVVQDGAVVDEWYAEQGGPDRMHAVMSVTKSLVGCVAGILVERGVLALDAAVDAYLPELVATAWAGATVGQLLDMRSGAEFVEDYADPESDVRRLDAWTVAGPRGPHDDAPPGLYAFLRTIRSGGPHGGPFRYRSAETDVLGWVCERVSGAPMAELIGDLVWTPMGAEHDAEILVDGTGTAVHDGGLAATARDLARFGQLLLDGGSVPAGPAASSPATSANSSANSAADSVADSVGTPSSSVSNGASGGAPVQVVPGGWLKGAWAVDADSRAAFLASPAEQSFPGGWYRRQFWFRPGAYGDVLLCLGIHGQLIHVSRRTRTVCIKLSSWPTAQNPGLLQDALWACDAVGGALAGLAERSGRHRLPGVVAGLTRRPQVSYPGSVI
jgi:CubicO group peptidase (beta-lactamase class C family)